MNLGLTPSLAFQLKMFQQNASIRSQLQTASKEVITGRREDVLSATRGRLGDALLLQKTITDVTRHQDAAKLAGTRIEGASGSLSAIREAVAGLTSEGYLALENNNGHSVDVFIENARSSLSQVYSALNRRLGNRHLFSGTQSSNPPLPSAEAMQTDIANLIAAETDSASARLSISNFFGAGGGFETNHYDGSVEAGPNLHVTTEARLDPLPKADNAVFRTIFEGLTLITESENAASEEMKIELITAGLDKLNMGTEGMLNMEARLGASLQRLDRLESTLSAEASVLSAAENSLLGKDTFEAAAELQALETQLQASYTITSRLSNLTLTNFLR